jgi:signal recognition particle subunit SRP54
MFESLGEKFDGLWRKLRVREDHRAQHRGGAPRRAAGALEADVNVGVVKSFVEAVKKDALGEEVLRSLTPEQHFIKLVHRELIRLLGEQGVALDLGGPAPVVLMLVGLNGAGKTTTAAKLARWLGAERGKRPYLASLDVYRPAAIEQLRVLGEQLGLPVHPTSADADPVRIARDAVAAARAAGADVVLLDTAGRQTVDENLMLELERIRAAVEPRQILLVADAMTGQDAVATAQGFAGRLPLTGVVLTKIEGDARGGAALSLRSVTGKPILFAGTGEKLDALEPFHPDRVASRILGMGDVLSLIERAEKAYDREGRSLPEEGQEGRVRPRRLPRAADGRQKMGSMVDVLG